MQEFSGLYIKKCIKAQNEIQYFRIFKLLTEEEDKFPVAKFPFEIGDYFNHPDLMEEGEVKIVEEIKGNQLYTSDSINLYLGEECVWIPTADQIREGLETIQFSLGDVSSYNEEQLIDEYMRTRKEKEWNKEIGDWVEIKKK